MTGNRELSKRASRSSVAEKESGTVVVAGMHLSEQVSGQERDDSAGYRGVRVEGYIGDSGIQPCRSLFKEVPMSTTTETAPSPAQAMASPKQQFLDTYEQEHQRTMRVLRAYPKAKVELQPHPKCKTARELAWMFVIEQ